VVYILKCLYLLMKKISYILKQTPYETKDIFTRIFVYVRTITTSASVSSLLDMKIVRNSASNI